MYCIVREIIVSLQSHCELAPSLCRFLSCSRHHSSLPLLLSFMFYAYDMRVCYSITYQCIVHQHGGGVEALGTTKEEDVAFWVVDGVVHPPTRLLYTQRTPLVLEERGSEYG